MWLLLPTPAPPLVALQIQISERHPFSLPLCLNILLLSKRMRTLPSVNSIYSRAGPLHFPTLAFGPATSAKGTLEPDGHITPGQASHQGVTRPPTAFPGQGRHPASHSPWKPKNTIFKITQLKDDCYLSYKAKEYKWPKYSTPANG